MALFFRNPLRSALTVAIVIFIAHFGTKSLTSPHAFQLTQTTIAILSILTLLFIIIKHHRMDGQLMSQSQEELAITGVVALLWIVFMMGYKTFINSKNLGSSSNASIGSSQGFKEPLKQQDPCSRDDVFCIYEEYIYF